MKKGDIFEGKVIRTEFPNKGIIDIEGQKVIVKNALEGQVVRFSINKKKRHRAIPDRTASSLQTFRYLRWLPLSESFL